MHRYLRSNYANALIFVFFFRRENQFIGRTSDDEKWCILNGTDWVDTVAESTEALSLNNSCLFNCILIFRVEFCWSSIRFLPLFSFQRANTDAFTNDDVWWMMVVEFISVRFDHKAPVHMQWQPDDSGKWVILVIKCDFLRSHCRGKRAGMWCDVCFHSLLLVTTINHRWLNCNAICHGSNSLGHFVFSQFIFHWLWFVVKWWRQPKCNRKRISNIN